MDGGGVVEDCNHTTNKGGINDHILIDGFDPFVRYFYLHSSLHLHFDNVERCKIVHVEGRVMSDLKGLKWIKREQC